MVSFYFPELAVPANSFLIQMVVRCSVRQRVQNPCALSYPHCTFVFKARQFYEVLRLSGRINIGLLA